MIKHILFSPSAVTVVLAAEAGMLTAPKWRDKPDRPSWPALVKRLGCEPFKSIRAYAAQHGIQVYG